MLCFSYFSGTRKSFDEFCHLIYRKYIRHPYLYNHSLYWSSVVNMLKKTELRETMLKQFTTEKKLNFLRASVLEIIPDYIKNVTVCCNLN